MAAAATERRSLDPLIWKACAGNSVQIPTVDLLVYYFPQGHAEQASSVPDFSSAAPCKMPWFVCSISGVQFLANQGTDEVYTKMNLVPRTSPAVSPVSSSLEDPVKDGGGVVSFAKILTPSDANNGGGFSVPRFCADSIFPALNFHAEPPVQMLFVRDVHGTVWDFRHIYRGTPRRHLLTTGWSKFVNSKKLVAGDSVVFLKNRSGELFVGVRRTGRSSDSSDFLHFAHQNYPLVAAPAKAAKPGQNSGGGEGFSRTCRCRIPPDTVVEAVRLAGIGRSFEVMYYPRAGSPDFVVKADVVEAALRVMWRVGMRVKMAVDSEDSSRTTWYQGTVSNVALQDFSPFPPSPWRMLEVTWDEPDVLQNVKTVSPWQVELVSASPQILSPYPATKKLRITQNQELLTDGAEQNMFFPMLGFTSTVMGSLFNYNTFPAGMQGARHDPICVSSLSNFTPNGIHEVYFENVNNNMPLKVNNVSTELNIGSTSQSESSSPPSQSSVHNYGTELFGNLACNTPTKVIGGSFQLFGKTIQTERPIGDDVNEGCKKNEDMVGPPKVFLSYPQKQLQDGHDVPPQEQLYLWVPPRGTHEMYSQTFNSNNMPLKVSDVSIELNIGSISQPETLSPPSQGSDHNYGTELLGNSAGNTPKVIGGYLQLFGKIIQTEHPVGGDVNEGCKKNEGAVGLPEVSLSYPQKQLHDGQDAPPRRVSAVEACKL